MSANVLLAMTLPGLVLGLVVFAFVAHLGRRRRNRPAQERPRRSAGAIGLEGLAGILDPGKAHELEQRQSDELLREEDAEGAPPRSHVDLDAGIARLRIDNERR
jgi:hypothetical protein